MPNPKVGTVTMNVGEAVTAEKKGKLDFRVDKAGIMHATIGRKSMGEDKLKDNFDALMRRCKSKTVDFKGNLSSFDHGIVDNGPGHENGCSCFGKF